jgi:hypothetical protein
MDLTTLLFIGIIFLVIVLLLTRNRSAGGPYYGSRGTERPTYDDPGYRSGGSIGAAEPPLQERSVGSNAPAAPSGSNRPANDDPNYRSGGSIGS